MKFLVTRYDSPAELDDDGALVSWGAKELNCITVYDSVDELYDHIRGHVIDASLLGLEDRMGSVFYENEGDETIYSSFTVDICTDAEAEATLKRTDVVLYTADAMVIND